MKSNYLLKSPIRGEVEDVALLLEDHVVLAPEFRAGEIVLKHRTSVYRGGSRAGWSKVMDPSWHEREAWRFERR